MIAMQENELDKQIELTRKELAAIIAFVHDADGQARSSEANIPDNILELLEEDEE